MARPTNKERIRRLLRAGKYVREPRTLNPAGRGWTVPLRLVREVLGRSADSDLMDLILEGGGFHLCVHDSELCLHLMDIRDLGDDEEF